MIQPTKCEKKSPEVSKIDPKYLDEWNENHPVDEPINPEIIAKLKADLNHEMQPLHVIKKKI